MARSAGIPVAQLRATCDLSSLNFDTTKELPPLQGILGQERGARALEFGLQVNKQGYNIFMTGITGTGKLSYAQEVVRELARQQPQASDWCYIYNFRKPNEPKAMSLPAGWGKRLRQDMQELVEELKVEIPRAFAGDDYENQKNLIVKEFQERNSAYFEDINQFAAQKDIQLKRTSTGFATIPLREGKPISQEDYEELGQEERERYEQHASEVQFKVAEVLRRVQNAEKEAREKIKQLESQIGLFAVGHLIDSLRETYQEFPQVISYLNATQEDILANLDAFRGEDEGQQQGFPWMQRMARLSSMQRYEVNLLIDNSETDGAPFVIENNPTYYNLSGRIEHENQWGFLTTDLTMIKPGALHRANGGYILLQVRDILANPAAWDALKRVLKTGELRLENMGEQYGLIPVATLRPEPIPVKVKVILIGNPLFYYLLNRMDEDFRKLFKVRADFDVEMERSPANILKMAHFISGQCQREDLLPFDRSAVGEVVDYSSWLAGDQQKLSTRFNDIVEVLFEADAWARLDGRENVTADHVRQAIVEKHHRSNLYEEKLAEMFARGHLLLDTSGRVTGQVNGLTVLDMGDYMFGHPTRITAAAGIGQRGVVNIERETRLSGAIHSKGVLILSGYLTGKYGPEVPLNLSASLCFEQTYGGVDGDSASSAELYALLSALAGVPIDQGLAVTGSVNQKGEIQPVGGINQKIEGFYRWCSLKGLTGEQGVIIPRQNVANLMLDHEVVEAVSHGKFHIYGVDTVDEGLELLTGLPAGQKDAEGRYPADSLHARVLARLAEFNRRLAQMRAREENQGGEDGSAPRADGDGSPSQDDGNDQDRSE
ncbi:MAG: ATP-binding protein [Clostridia bacterium]|nr:MAG: ATP-binding protein [Clostridia bacterium]